MVAGFEKQALSEIYRNIEEYRNRDRKRGRERVPIKNISPFMTQLWKTYRVTATMFN